MSHLSFCVYVSCFAYISFVI